MSMLLSLVNLIIHLTEEIQTLRANLKQARLEYQTLEAEVRELRSKETSTQVCHI